MAFTEFRGKLDKPAGTGFAPFSGKLDAPLDQPEQSLPEPILSPEEMVMSSIGAASSTPPAAPDNRSTMTRIGDFLRPQYKSVLETAASPQQQQLNVDRRLSYGAGPISQETEAAAADVRSGQAAAKNKTVKKVAEVMAERGQPTFADLVASTPASIKAVRDAKAEEFRSAGEWAADTLSGISQGAVGLVQLPLNIFAPSGELSQTLRDTQKELQSQESDVLKAQRSQLLERVQNEDGFFGKYFATVENLVTNPALSISEAAKQVPNFLGIMGVAKLGGALTGGAINAASRASPTIALAEAISGNALRTGAQAAGTTAGGISAATLMTSGDAAGNTYATLTDPKKTPMSVWRTNPDFQKLVAQGKTPKQAIEEIATAKARLAAAIVAPLGVLGFMGAESAILAQAGSRAAMQAITPKGAAKILGKEIGLEQVEEGGTQAGSNVASQTINPQQSLTEGVPEAMGTAAITAAPFAGAAVARQALQDQQAQPDPFAEAEARRRLDVQSYDPSIVDPASTRRPPGFDAGKQLEKLLKERDAGAMTEQPPAVVPPVLEAVPGMTQDEDLAQEENVSVTPVTVTPPRAPITLYRGVPKGRESQETVGGALFMSPDRSVAETYAGKQGVVAKETVTFNNMLSAPTWAAAKEQLGLPQSASMADLVNAARNAGHDGVTFVTQNGPEYIYIPAAGAAVTPKLPVAQANEPAMRVTDGAKQPVPMSALITPEALKRAGDVLAVSERTPERILFELNKANDRGGLATWEVETILGLRGQKQTTAPTTAVTPVTPVKPTIAAATLPETPTVPPVNTPKLFEPPVAGHAVKDFPVVQVPVADLQLSKDVPQFKAGATDKGVVDQLTGKFTQEGVAPIAVWRRLDGTMEVISGRHRLDLAQRSKTKSINAQVYDEAQGFSAADASTLDAELNIRDEQGKVKDYVNYFKNSGTDKETAESKGLLGRVKGKRGFAIANQGADALITALNGDQIGDEAAYYIALNAPNDNRLQGVGLQAIMDGKSMNTAVNTMQAVKAMAAERDTTTDMFGFDDSLIKEAQEMAKIAAKMQQSIASRLSAISGAAKNPAMAKAEGIDVRDPEAVKRRIEELRAQKAALENWSTSPELVAEIRAARGVEAPQFELKSETPQETVARESTQDADRRAAEQKTRVDNEVDFFELQPSTQETSEAPTDDMFAGEAGPSAEYQAASELANRASAAFRKVQEAYRKQEIGDEDYLAGRKVHDAAIAAFDKAIKKEQGQAEPTEAIKDEKEFIEESTKDKLEAITQDFMVGDMVRFGSIPGTVVGLEGDYVRMRPDAATAAKAYQRVPKTSLTFVGRPDTTSMVSYSKEQDNKFGEEAGQLNANMGNLIQLLGANMYSSSLAEVTVKELLQNSFDAVKGAVANTNSKGEKIQSLYKTGKVQITINSDDRTISISDDARGMTPQIVRDAFFTVAGSDKSDLPPGQRSGGLGLAKMGFMLGAQNLKLDTVRDGVRVTVDTSSVDIANNNFKILKSPAPKGEHGTTVTVKIPEFYIDPKNGEERSIYFPYSLRSIEALKQPLIGPVEVSFKNDTDDNLVLPVGINFADKDYNKFKANFDWGSADIFFGIQRKQNKYDINHKVLSAGVYQFSPDFSLDNEKIPYDIVVNIAPNVDARHPDYPFVNSRESFKTRIKQDVEALTLYLGQISRGLEARDLQDSFKDIVSMPRIEAGQDIADISDKLKKTFGTQKADKPTAVKDLPKEVTITSNDVTDTTTKQVLVDVKAKREEKEKGASFKGSAVLMPADYMLNMKQDPRLPAFHNNTNVDYLTIGRQYGEPEKFFAELGTLVVEMKEELAKSGFYGYEKLAPESLFFAGISIDKQYGGVHIRVPYKALFINPFYDFGARTLFGIRQNQLNTMVHEIAHIATMQHGVAHNTQMIKVEQYLADEGLLDYYNDAILDILRRHESTFTAMKEAYDKSSTQNTSKSLEDYEQGSASASTRGDTDGTGDAPSAVSSRAGQGRGKGVSRTQEDDAEQDRSADREDGRPGNFLMNIEKPKKLPPGRTPELAEAAKRLKAGEITKEDFDALVNKFRPVVTYDAPLQPATDEQVFDALDVFKRTKINPPIAAGYPVGLRLDIPAYNRAGVFVVSIHEKRTPSSPGKVIGYSSVAEIKNVTFGLGNQKAALDIAMGKGKDAIQTMEGSFVPTNPAEALRKARAAFQSGDYVQIGIDPTRHAYFFDRANTQPVVYAEEILQIGNMVLGKGVRYGNKKDYLYNAEPSLAEQEESDLTFDGKKIREEQIKEYAALRAKLARVPKKVAEGEVDLGMQRSVARLMQQARDLNVTIKATKPRLDSAEQFLAKAAIEFDKGNISEDVFKVIKAAYDKKPELLAGLRLSVKAPGDSERAAGQFLAFSRVVRLFKGTSGATDPKTVQHELTHSLEQMMTPEQRSVIAQAWVKGLLKAIKSNPDEKHQKYFNAVMDFIDKPNETTYRKALDLLPSYEMYQFVNPSEFWAVNAQNLMAAELGTAWDKFKRAIARLWEGIKNVLGFDNRYAVQKMFKDVMNGSKERITTDVIADFVNGAGVKSKVLENIEDDKNLLEKYNRPNTPQLDQTPIKTQIVDAGKTSKDFFVSAVSDPLEALGTAANSVDRAILYARNKNVWFGSGLNAADFAKYNGELLTSQGLATASVAMDNAIRGGQIATEVIFQGGIKFDTKSRNFVAVKRDKGMAGVYEAEIALKKRLGDQLGTDIIQGYLEAKRSRSIQSEYFAREAEFEFLESNFKDLQETNAPEEDIMAARDAMVEAKDDLKAIELVYKKVRMSDEEIDEFIARDKVHPELRQIMNNWSAVNKNMLGFWRQVGLLSQKRYDNLSNITDYVPWQRIMNDETDVHSPAQTTNRKMTNIGLEKLFKKGVPTVITDVVAKEGQQTFKIQPATVLEVEINGNPVAQDKITATADGQVKLDVPVTEGDLVVFKASREIENIIDNMTRNVMRMTMNGLRQAAAQRIVMEYATRDKNGKIMMFPKAERERGRFDFVVNGQRVVVEIQDPLISESIFGMESLDIAMLAPLAAVANFTRRTITLSGVFQIKQVFKDAPTAALVTGVRHPLLLMGGIYKGFVTSLLNTDPTVQILKSAGIGGFQSAARTPEAEIKRRLGIMNRNVFDFVIKGLDHIGDASDMAQRVAVYKRVLAETGNETQALYQAANVINFLHHGSGQVAQAIVKTVPFAGASANSMDVLVQALAGGGLKGRSRANALARLAATGTLLTGITLLYCFLVGDDEEYNQMDDQTKMRNFMIPGTKILLPMNTSAAYFYKAVPEMIYNKIIKEGTKNAVDARRLRTALKEAAIDMLLGPTPVPSGAKQILEIGLNKDFFTGRPVVPESLAKLEAAERYTTETSEAGKFLSSLTGTKETRLLDPLQADHIIRGIFGTAGAMAQWFTNSIAVASGERAAMTDKQQPITGPFLRADVGRRNEDLFYDFKAEVDKRYGTYAKMLEREDDKQADAYEEKYSDILDFYQEVNKMDSELKEINAEIRYYGESKDTGMTPVQRREEIKLLQLEKQEMLDDIIEMRKDAGL